MRAMIRSRSTSRRATGGFSLIELMVALVAGLIVVGAVLAFTVSSVGANADFVKSTRLMQELRNASDHVTSELKRAGYDEAAMDYVSNPSLSAVSVFAPILVDETANKNCVIYAYDRSPGTPGGIDLGTGEVRAIRRATAEIDGVSVGVIEVAESTATVTPVCGGDGPDYTEYPAVCLASSGWCPLTDPRAIDITAFTIDPDAAAGRSRGVTTIDASSGFNALQLREFGVTIQGALRGDASVTRTLASTIKVRADCLRASVTSCGAAPAVPAPPSP